MRWVFMALQFAAAVGLAGWYIVDDLADGVAASNGPQVALFLALVGAGLVFVVSAFVEDWLLMLLGRGQSRDARTERAERLAASAPLRRFLDAVEERRRGARTVGRRLGRKKLLK